MKYIIFLIALSFATPSFAFDSCSRIFRTDLQEKPEETLSVVELSAMYYANYIKSRQGQEHIARMNQLLSMQLTLKPVNGAAYYEFSYKPKKPMSVKTVNKIRSSFPEVIFTYQLEQLNY